LRHITKADVEGSAALALVVSGVVFGGPFMIAASPSEFAPSPEDAASAVATLGFFFVMLQELKNTKCIYIHMPWFMVLNISTGSYTEVGNSRYRCPVLVVRGKRMGDVPGLLMYYSYQKFTPLTEFRTLSLNAINHDKMALCIIHHCSISLHEVVHHTHQPPTHHPDLTYAPSSYEGPGSSKFEIGTV
jgi:hypothetical protein